MLYKIVRKDCEHAFINWTYSMNKYDGIIINITKPFKRYDDKRSYIFYDGLPFDSRWLEPIDEKNIQPF